MTGTTTKNFEEYMDPKYEKGSGVLRGSDRNVKITQHKVVITKSKEQSVTPTNPEDIIEPILSEKGSEILEEVGDKTDEIGLVTAVAAKRAEKKLSKSLLYGKSQQPPKTTIGINIGKKARGIGITVSTKLVQNTATVLKVLGPVAGAVGIVSTLDQMATGKKSIAQGTTDLIFSGIGFLGPWGAGASFLYFTISPYFW